MVVEVDAGAAEVQAAVVDRKSVTALARASPVALAPMRRG
jgi:hypothetical protein